MSTTSILTQLDPELIPKGFSRRRLTWNRAHDSLVEVVDVQISKSGDSATLNVGVLARPIYLKCWGREAERFVEEPDCTVRARVGQLLDNLDHWWPIDGTNSGAEMASCVRSSILPFIERMRSLGGMREWLASCGAPSAKLPLPSICLATIEAKLGDQDRACEILQLLANKALGGWRVRAQEVALRIDCPNRLRQQHRA